MCARNNYSSKLMNNATLVRATITEIIEKNKEYSERLKNVFKCIGKSGNEKICILWDRSNIDKGDEVQMLGRFKDEIFLVWSIQIIKKKEKEHECQ